MTYLRHPRTRAERVANGEKDIRLLVRGARSRNRLPNDWDDIRGRQPRTDRYKGHRRNS